MTPADVGGHTRQPETDAPPTLRLADLLGLRVETTDGTVLGTVRDVRLRTSPDAGPGTRLVTQGILLGGRHHEVRWGYDRHPQQGPRAVAVLARLLHRHSTYLPWRDVASLDLDHRVLRVQAPSRTGAHPGSAPSSGTS